MKERTKIPKSVSEAVLKEFNHLCSICGEPRPQLHHIDEDHKNHDPLNLLPLCPNHHLTDQHNPTSKIDPQILALFRNHKDPTILMPESEPIFRRILLLNKLMMRQKESQEQPGSKWPEIWSSVNDLVEFLRNLNMGAYYSLRLKMMFQGVVPDDDDEGISRGALEQGLKQWESTHQALVALFVEMLRYQHWSRMPNRLNKQTPRRT